MSRLKGDPKPNRNDWKCSKCGGDLEGGTFLNHKDLTRKIVELRCVLCGTLIYPDGNRYVLLNATAEADLFARLEAHCEKKGVNLEEEIYCMIEAVLMEEAMKEE